MPAQAIYKRFMELIQRLSTRLDHVYHLLFDGWPVENDGVNYIEIASNGFLTMHGDARVLFPIKVFTAAELQRGLAPPDSGVLGNFSFEEYTIDDDSILNTAIWDSRENSTDILVYIRWGIDEAYATNSGEIQWQIEWSTVPDDSSEPLDSPIHSGTVQSGDLNIPATAKTILETILTIPGDDITNGDELGISLSRIDIDDGTDPTAEPGVVIVAILTYTNKLGVPI